MFYKGPGFKASSLQGTFHGLSEHSNKTILNHRDVSEQMIYTHQMLLKVNGIDSSLKYGFTERL
jgi:hypothetical protein